MTTMTEMAKIIIIKVALNTKKHNTRREKERERESLEQIVIRIRSILVMHLCFPIHSPLFTLAVDKFQQQQQ